MLSKYEKLVRYLNSNSGYKTTIFPLPNYFKVFWVSSGPEMTTKYSLNSIRDCEIIFLWWLRHLKHYYNSAYFILDFIKKYHSISENEVISPIMSLIWKHRDDLQKKFPRPKDKDNVQFLHWWKMHGCEEYYLPIVFENKNPLIGDILDSIPKSEHNNIQNGVTSAISKYHQPFSKGKDKSIALIGHIQGIFGLGEDARQTKESLELYSYDVTSYSAFSETNAYKMNEIKTSPLSNIYSRDSNHSAHIFCLPAFDFIGIFMREDPRIFLSKPIILFTQWELKSFPKEAEIIEILCDKIFCISNFCSKSISEILNNKSLVETIEQPITPAVLKGLNRKHFQLNNSDFIFYVGFDRNSSCTRKNPLGAIEAFQRAFPVNEDVKVKLIIKVIGNQSSEQWNECLRRALCDTRIIIFDKILLKDELNDLMNCCDCVVSLHRAEGFGRVLAEAMLLNKPVIGSAYSGNLDFMNNKNSFLISGKEVPIFKGEYIFYKNNVWFSPNIDECASIMRYLCNNPKKYKHIYSKNAQFIEKKYSKLKTGESISKALKELI